MSRGARRTQLNVALLCGLAVLACVLLMHVPGMGAGLAYLAPGVFVFVLLRLGRYPGQNALLARMRKVRRRHARPVRSRATRRASPMPRGGTLLAAALAGRAPPLSTRS